MHIPEEKRLQLPRVLLVSLAPAVFSHGAKIALGVASVAAFLRARQAAEVQIIDMRLGASQADVLTAVAELEPDLVGFSIDFGEMAAFTALMDELVEASRGPVLFAGNILAHLFTEELLARYPRLLVNYSEGELFALDLIEHLHNRRPLAEISALAYVDPDSGEVKRSPVRELAPEQLPYPAMDTLEQVAAQGGGLMLELSRGCAWSSCSFCSRTHKGRGWRGLAPEQAAEWLIQARATLDRHPRMARGIYLCDEEFIGPDSGRLQRFADVLLSQGFEERFELNTRVNQIYCPGHDSEWHVARWRALHACRQAGLSRILLGVESGAGSTLQRFGKGHRVIDAVRAMQVLTALDINVRATFIAYDPCMTRAELVESYQFLARRDALLRTQPCSEPKLRALLRRVIDGSVSEISTGEPLYRRVCYLHNSLKVLPDSSYADLAGHTKDAAAWYVHGREPGREPELGRAGEEYQDPLLGAMAAAGEHWTAITNRLSFEIAQPVRDQHQRPLDQQTRKRLVAAIHDASFFLFGAFAFLASGEMPADLTSSAPHLAAELKQLDRQLEGAPASSLADSARTPSISESVQSAGASASRRQETPVFGLAPRAAVAATLALVSRWLLEPIIEEHRRGSGSQPDPASFLIPVSRSKQGRCAAS